MNTNCHKANAPVCSLVLTRCRAYLQGCVFVICALNQTGSTPNPALWQKIQRLPLIFNESPSGPAAAAVTEAVPGSTFWSPQSIGNAVEQKVKVKSKQFMHLQPLK